MEVPGRGPSQNQGNNPAAPANAQGQARGVPGATDTIVLRINRSELRRDSKDSATSLDLDSDETRRRLGEFLFLKTGISPCSSRNGSRASSPMAVRPGVVSTEGSPLASVNRRRSREVSRSATPTSPQNMWPEPKFSDESHEEDTDTEDHERVELPPSRERRKEKSRMRIASRKTAPTLILDASQPGEDEEYSMDGDETSMNKKRHTGNGMGRRPLPEPLAAQDVTDMMEGMSGLGEPMQLVNAART